jgi:hypothetical protein
MPAFLELTRKKPPVFTINTTTCKILQIFIQLLDTILITC